MPCYHPVTAWRSRAGRSSSGSWPLVFNKSEGYTDKEVQIPCGGCIGCRLEYSRQWALRCVSEASEYEKNCFVTLTYNDENLPSDLSLSKPDILKFIKNMRYHYGSIRYFLCGEYGDRFDRPHYHLCLFNFAFDDLEEIGTRYASNTYSELQRKYKSLNRTFVNDERSVYDVEKIPGEFRIYRSEKLERVWTKGFSTIGELTFESAAYVARYVTKKIKGKNVEDYYQGREPEFALMSRRPGIGKYWFDKWHEDVKKIDGMAKDRLTYMPPKYYDNIIKNTDPDKYKKIKERRKKRFKELSSDVLARRENYHLIMQKKKRRSYEK